MKEDEDLTLLGRLLKSPSPPETEQRQEEQCDRLELRTPVRPHCSSCGDDLETIAEQHVGDCNMCSALVLIADLADILADMF